MSRRLVAVLFLDLVGWTRLAERVDPEPLQLLLDQYYDICCTRVEDHGGVVEKFIGDAVMAVFGATTSQEDDASRALRTAFQIRADVGALRTPGATPRPVEVHCGIAAGEALVTHSPRAGIRVVGDVVNLAARIQSKAIAGEIMVNELMGHLARPYFTMIPVPPLSLKGKAEPVPVLLATGPVTAGQTGDVSRLVDRDTECSRLRAAFDGVTRDRQSRLVAVLGPPGIGKTRLVREVTDEFGAARATVVFGRCPSYGANGTYVALVQVLDALARQDPGCRDRVLADSHLSSVLTDLRNASRSRYDGSGPRPSVEEVSWAARELFAAVTALPLVVVWDGLEAAGHAQLTLVGDLMDSLPEAALLMICVARPELTDLDIGWVRGLSDQDVITVGGLAPMDSARLVATLAAGSPADVQAHDLELIDRATIYGAGNPLFIRLMVESAAPGRPLDEVPPTITAIVGAMLDRLPAALQHLLGAASVIGPTFTVGQLTLLCETSPGASLEALAERQLIHTTAEAGGYSFVQRAVREVTYGRLDKEQRFTWHRCLAERDVSPTFHFEAAVRLLADLRPDDAQLRGLSGRAAECLLREGTAALRQRDLPTAIGLLDRAVRLASDGPDRGRAVAAIRLSDALLLSGATRRAVDVVTELARHSRQRPHLVQQQLLAVRLGGAPEMAVEDLLAELETDPGDRLAWCRFEQLRMLLYLGQGRFRAAEEATLAALEHARAIGDGYEEDRLLAALCEVRQWSPTPVATQLSGCAELAERFADDRYLLVPVLAARARCLALTADPAGAHAALAEAATAVEQLRLTMGQVLIDQAAGLAHALDGAHTEAHGRYRAAAEAVERAGFGPIALTLQVLAAREHAQHDPAGEAATEIKALLDRRDEMDVRGRILCMSAAVRLAAVNGMRSTMDGDVLVLLDRTDDPCLRGEAYFDLAQAKRLLGNHSEAAALARAAVACYRAIGATRPLWTVQAWM